MHTTHIIPAYIPDSREALSVFLKTFSRISTELQVDVVDGLFVPSISWPFTEERWRENLQEADFRAYTVELDLMIKDPERSLDLWLRTHPSKIVIHVESTEKLDEVLEHAGRGAYKLGLAFNNDTDLALLNDIDISCVDYVQLMGIAQIGKQSQPFDERVLERIVYLKEHHPDLPVSIDGSVNLETIARLRDAGANRFVVGSALLRAEDPKARFLELARLAGTM